MIDFIFEQFITHGSISTDTRKIKPKDIFFALKGPSFNGNQYAQSALEKGATYVVIDEVNYQKDERYLLVDDVLNTLQKLARKYRDSLNIPVIAVTGSNGKTTSKELINAVLEQKLKTFATQGNLNNHIGVPLTLLSIPKDTEIAVIELGANHIGEIETLCQIANPNYGLVTNIGMDHLEGYGSLEGVARGSSELFYHFLKNGGTAFVNKEDEILVRMSKRLNNIIYYPQNCKLSKNDFFLEIELFTGEKYTTQLIGEYNFYNISLALCIAQHFEVDLKLAAKAIQNYEPKNNRSQIVRQGNNVFILDAYNANPSSMSAAVENFAKIKADKKVLILGDMLELGSFADSEHEKMIALVDKLNFDKVIFCGPQFHKFSNSGNVFVQTTEELKNWLENQNFNETHFLLKGSRGMALEKVVNGQNH